MPKEKEYLIPESQLFRLMKGCASVNGCKKYGQVGCECSNQSLLSEANLIIDDVDTDRLLESEFNSCDC